MKIAVAVLLLSVSAFAAVEVKPRVPMAERGSEAKVAELRVKLETRLADLVGKFRDARERIVKPLFERIKGDSSIGTMIELLNHERMTAEVTFDVKKPDGSTEKVTTNIRDELLGAVEISLELDNPAKPGAKVFDDEHVRILLVDTPKQITSGGGNKAKQARAQARLAQVLYNFKSTIKTAKTMKEAIDLAGRMAGIEDLYNKVREFCQ